MDARDLLLRIAGCKRHWTDIKEGRSACSVIFNYQTKHGTEKLLPVPWQGRIEQAKVLFVGSNPSELNGGDLPEESWLKDEEKVADFFESRFDERPDINPRKWSSGGTRYRLKTGEQSRRQVQYWRVIKEQWAPQILEKYLGGKAVAPGVDYALTEIVHCYSKEDVGVPEAKSTCSTLYFNDILESAKDANVIVVMGAKAISIMNEYLRIHSELNKTSRPLDWRILENKKGVGIIKAKSSVARERLILALPHPGAYQFPTQLDRYLTGGDIEILQYFVGR